MHRSAGFFLGDPFDVFRGELYVLGDGHMRVEVELLEDEADLRSQGRSASSFLSWDLDAVNDELAGGDLLQRVYAPEQRALARTGRPR